MIDDFIKYSSIRKSEHTIQAYKTDLTQFQGFHPSLVSATSTDISNFLGFLSESGLGRNTLARKLSAISSFYNYLKRIKIVEFNPAELVENIKPTRTIPEYLKLDEIELLRGVCGGDLPLKCLFEFLLTTGLREAELCSLNRRDIDYDRKELRVIGKGNKVRVVMIPDHTLELLRACVTEEEALFVNKTGRRLTSNMVYYRIRRLGQRVHLNVYPHLLRHTFATYLLDGGSTLVEVQELLGHEDVSTTAIYTHTTAEKRGRYDKAVGRMLPRV